jgi:oligoendopeptidase F
MAKGKNILPEWDLSDLYDGIHSSAIEQDKSRAQELADSFVADYAHKVEQLSAKELAQAIASCEVLSDLLGRLGSYAQLVYAGDMMSSENAQFYQNICEFSTDLSSKTLFFTLSINRIDEAALQKMLASSPELTHYAPWLRDVRAMKPYQLSDEIEKLLHEKSVTGHAAWCRLFDETMAQMRFPLDGQKLSSAEIFDLLSSRHADVRKKAAKVIGETLKKNAHIFTLITNTLAKDKDIEDQWRGFKEPISARNVSNQLEDDVVETLLTAVRANYARLSHRYYAVKATWLGDEKLNYWDRNAPLPEDDDALWSWDDAVELVLGAYKVFSPELAAIGKQFFDNGWIDAPVRAGKSPGAFAHPTVPSAHPYLLVNFQGKTRDVMTLAHELGHGVHQVLSAKQGALMADTPLTLAETASVFGEQLVFQEVLRREKNKARRRILIAGKVEDMLNTVVRQVAFCTFEQRVHAERKSGELTTERLGEIWMDVQRESLGSAFRFKKPYAYYWSYIPHFIHSSFYVYAYAFGDCLVNALYARYQSDVAQGNAVEFEKQYLQMLQAGGTLRHKELLAPFGIDVTDANFWQQGLDIISGYIDELEG